MQPAECHTILHVNYNCRDLTTNEGWYTSALGMRPLMRSRSEGSTPGDPFGVYQPIVLDSVYLYDHRGGRYAPALQMAEWIDPPTIGHPYSLDWNRGIHSLGFAVGDIDATVDRAERHGARLVRRAGKAALLRDRAGIAVELFDLGSEQPELRHARIVCSDLGRTLAWYEPLGLRPVGDTFPAASDLWTGDDSHQLTREVTVSTADGAAFSLLFSTWSGSPPAGPSYATGFHQGVYRIGLAVDDLSAAYEALRHAGVALNPPYRFPIPDTPLADGVDILFLHDPDGVSVELVERPRALFRK